MRKAVDFLHSCYLMNLYSLLLFSGTMLGTPQALLQAPSRILSGAGPVSTEVIYKGDITVNALIVNSQSLFKSTSQLALRQPAILDLISMGRLKPSTNETVRGSDLSEILG